ncbi:MAG: hypothetical protein KAF91_31010, partial [Nostoc sp. TH1S01]|nr:hypothetical protein [Nostoc sp. TH1S01]
RLVVSSKRFQISTYYYYMHSTVTLFRKYLATPHTSFPCLPYEKIYSKMQSSPPALYPDAKRSTAIARDLRRIS